MKNTLIDTGPMVALFNSDDRYHNDIISLLKTYRGILTSSWPVITEACYLLSYNPNVLIDFLKWIDRGGLKIVDIEDQDLKIIIDLMQKYPDIPMDMADASILAISERLNIKEIMTIDSDCYIYRTPGKEMLNNIFKDQ